MVHSLANVAILPLFITATVYLLFALCVNAVDQPPKLKVPLVFPGRVFTISSDAPFSSVLNSDPDARKTVLQISDIFLHLELNVLRARIAGVNDIRQRDDYRVVSKCSSEDISWRTASNAFMRVRGWKFNRGKRCLTDVRGFATNARSERGDSLSEASMEHITNKFSAILNEHAQEIVKRSVKNWTHPEYTIAFQYIRNTIKCDVQGLTAFRIDGDWYVTAVLTNVDSRKWLPEGERFYMEEFMRVRESDGFLEPALMILPVRAKNGTMPEVVGNSTTSLSRWGGASGSSKFFRDELKNNRAVRNAVEEGDRQVQQVEGAVTASNIAILSLPLVLNLIPVALVADVSFCSMLLFVLLSDVLTTLPMAIKGVELMIISQQRFRAMVVRMGDTRDGAEMTLPAEMSVATCQTTMGGTEGVVFVSVAISAMVAGLTLEVLARWYRYVVRTQCSWREGFLKGSSHSNTGSGTEGSMDSSVETWIAQRRSAVEQEILDWDEYKAYMMRGFEYRDSEISRSSTFRRDSDRQGGDCGCGLRRGNPGNGRHWGGKRKRKEMSGSGAMSM